MASSVERTTVALALLLTSACGTSVPAGPNIVLVTLDTLRADHLGCYGYFRDTSPHIDALAEECVLFERCIAPMATTLPTHVSLFTGTWPLEHGILANVRHTGTRFKRSEQLATFAEYLAELGYETAAFVSALPLKAKFGLDAGFDSYDHPTGPERDARATTDRVLAWLDRGPEHPFFLWVHYFDAHNPYEPPAPHDRAFTADGELETYLAERRFEQQTSRAGGNVVHAVEATNAYDGEIRFMDEQIGRVCTVLKERGLWDDAVIVVVGDHGEGLGQHGEPGHGLTWDEQLSVPFLIRGPGIAPRRVAAVTSVVDVLPTLLGSLALPGEEGFRAQTSGADALAVDFETRPVLSQTSPRQGAVGEEVTYTLTTDRWKLVRTESGEEQLYDLHADPFELEDVHQSQEAVARELSAELLRTLRDQNARGDRLRKWSTGRLRDPMGRGAKLGADEELTPGELEDMRALGYGGGDE